MSQILKEREKIYNHLKANDDSYYVNEIYLMATSNDTLKMGSEKNGFFRARSIFFFSAVVSGVLLFVNLLYEQKIDYNKKTAIARVDREKNKIANVYEGIQFIGDDIKNKDFSMYRVGARKKRLLFIFNRYLKDCVKDYKRVEEILNYEQLSPFSVAIMRWCVKRIPHTVVYKNSVENIMHNYNLASIYIGATHERFALIAEDVSRKNKIRLICIPHGIEGTKKLPREYVGNKFYCSSSEIASKLNMLYDTKKFIFDSEITTQMYRIKGTDEDVSGNREKRVIFFTQPIYVEQSKQIIVKIANHFKKKGQMLYIKVHPLEKSSEYSIENTEIISDFNDAIVGNICISALSTILVEAIYNNSKPISIINLINGARELSGDTEFLNDIRIFKPKDEKTLMELMNNIY